MCERVWFSVIFTSVHHVTTKLLLEFIQSLDKTWLMNFNIVQKYSVVY